MTLFWTMLDEEPLPEGVGFKIQLLWHPSTANQYALVSRPMTMERETDSRKSLSWCHTELAQYQSSMSAVKDQGTHKSKLATAGIQGTLCIRDFGVLPTFGDCIAVRNASRATVGGTITTIATTSAACSIAARLAGAALIGISWQQSRIGLRERPAFKSIKFCCLVAKVVQCR